MTDMAMRLFRAGHLPRPRRMVRAAADRHAGSKRIGDAAFDEIFHPIIAPPLSPNAMLACASAGLRKARMKWSRWHGHSRKQVFLRYEDVPPAL